MIQAALDAGGVVTLPAGTWQVGSAPYLIRAGTTAVLGHGCRLVGGATRSLQTEIGAQLGDLTIEGVEVEGGGSTGQHHAITVLDGGTVTVRGCVVRGCAGDGVYIGGRVAVGVVEDCHAERVGRNGVSIVAPVGVIRRCVSRGAGWVGLKYERSSEIGAVSATIEDCEATGSYRADYTIGGWGAGGAPLSSATLRRCVGDELLAGGYLALVVEGGALRRIRRSGAYAGTITVRALPIPVTVG